MLDLPMLANSNFVVPFPRRDALSLLLASE